MSLIHYFLFQRFAISSIIVELKKDIDTPSFSFADFFLLRCLLLHDIFFFIDTRLLLFSIFIFTAFLPSITDNITLFH